MGREISKNAKKRMELNVKDVGRVVRRLGKDWCLVGNNAMPLVYTYQSLCKIELELKQFLDSFKERGQ